MIGNGKFGWNEAVVINANTTEELRGKTYTNVIEDYSEKALKATFTMTTAKGTVREYTTYIPKSHSLLHEGKLYVKKWLVDSYKIKNAVYREFVYDLKDEHRTGLESKEYFQIVGNVTVADALQDDRFEFKESADPHHTSWSA